MIDKSTIIEAMPNQRITMQRIHKLIELHQSGVSQRAISNQLGIHRRTIFNYLDFLKSHFGADLTPALSLSESSLWQLIHVEESPSVKDELLKLFPEYQKNLSKVGVTKRLLWEKYFKQTKGAISYSRFCRLFREWEATSKLSLRMEHKSGDKLFIDFAGNKLHIVDAETKEKIALEVFVAVLGYSQLTYCQAILSQKKSDFLSALANSLTFFGGVPQAIVPDNLKSAVNKSNRYEPDINESMVDFAEHYQTTIYPTRSYRPKDKALVEKTVNILYTRIYAALADKVFYSITALNEAIRGLLATHNQTPFQGKEESRQDRFDTIERQSLQTLPTTRYELKSFRLAKVHPDCHVKLSEDTHYYSVPYKYVGKTVKIRYSAEIVEIYFEYNRIAIHQRMIAKGGYTTLKEHLHPSHQWVMNWSAEFFEDQAAKIGENILKAIQQIIASRKYPEQAYKSCAGVLALAKKVGNKRIDDACERALAYEYVSMKLIQSIIDRELDKVPIRDTNFSNDRETPMIPLHPNIRGSNHYQ
jgi:transposase